MASLCDYSSVVECLSKFQTHNLDAAWLKSAWDGDHSQLEILPADFETVHQDTDWTSILRDTCTEIRHFVSAGNGQTVSSAPDGSLEEGPSRDSPALENDVESATSFWVNLVENGISFKGVVIVAGCLIERGSSRTSQFAQSDLALQAASLYLCLICIPGSSAFRLFHPVLYHKAIELFTMAKRFTSARVSAGSAVRSGGKRKRIPAKVIVKRKSRTVVGKNVGGGDIEESIGSGDDDSAREHSIEAEDDTFTVHEIKLLRHSMRQLVLDLKLFLTSYTFKRDAQSLEYTIERLSELLNLEGNSQAVELGLLSKGIHACLKLLCTEFHGSVKMMVTSIMKRMFGMLLYNATHGIINFICQLANDIPDGMALPGIRILIQNMCVKAPERAEARHKLSIVILVLIDHLPPSAFFSIVVWLLRLMQNSKVNLRIFALEIVALILGRNPKERSLAHFPTDELQNVSCQCLHAVLARCSDIASTVRSKALAVLANCVTTENSLAYGAVLEIFAPKSVSRIRSQATRLPSSTDASYNGVQQTVADPQQSSSGVSSLIRSQEKSSVSNGPIPSTALTSKNFSDTSSMLVGVSKSSQEKSNEGGNTLVNCSPEAFQASSALPSLPSVMELLRDRVADKKVHVRKAAVQVLQRVMELNPECLSIENVQTLQERCLDTSILVKKQSMQALTAILLSFPSREDLQQAWLEGILPSIVDPESSIQEKCIEMVDDVLLKNIVVHSQSRSSLHLMVWKIMNEIVHNDAHLIKAWRFMQRIFFHMARSGKLRKNLIQVLQSYVNTENDDAAWLLLSGLALCIDIKNSNFVFTYWDTHQHELEKRSITLTNVLKVMSAVCKHSDEATVTKYFTSLSALLEELSCSYKMIATLVETIGKLSGVKKSNKATSMLHNVCANVFKKCERYLNSVFLIEANKVKAIDEDSTIKHLAALAEVAMVNPKLSSERICIILKSIMATKCSTTQVAENIDILGTQETQCSQRLVKFCPGALSQRLQNFALVTLGKLCLQNEKLAKDCTPALGKMLETSPDPAARNNIVVILVDLCIRYTTMVDPYFPSVTACLKDRSFMVRNQTLTLLTHLLQEDYIKWRGSLFFCFVTALVDPSPSIRLFTEHAILHVLTKRHPAMLFQHFVECLFFFNCYQDHEVYNNITQSEKEAKLFSLAGEKNIDKRMTLYTFMLVNMSDEHRFQVTAKVCQDILGGTVNDMIKLKRANGTICKNGHNLVMDTLAILSCDEIKLATLRSTPQDELEDADFAAAAIATVKKTVISQVVRKSVIENIVPILIALKHKLEKLHSPLVKNLMVYFKELVRGDYKVEVKEVLAADKQLSAEIEYDLKKFEQEYAAEQQKIKSLEALAQLTVTDDGNALNPRTEQGENVPHPMPALTSNAPAQMDRRNSVCVQQPLSTTTENDRSRLKVDISMLPVVQLEKLDNSVLRNRSISVVNDSKATLYDERMAETVINSPAPTRIVKRRLSSTARTNKQQAAQLNIQERPDSAMGVVNPASKSTSIPPSSAVALKAEPLSPIRPTGNAVPITPTKQAIPSDLMRAISTPCGVITDITFRMASDNLSPIANRFPQDMLLHVMTPECASTQSEKWGVVPKAKPTALSTVEENEMEN